MEEGTKERKNINEDVCSIDLKKKRVKEGDGSRVTFTEVCRSEAIGKIHRDELAQKLCDDLEVHQ